MSSDNTKLLPRSLQSIGVMRSIAAIVTWPTNALDELVNRNRPKERAMTNDATCPFSGDARKHTAAGARSNADWWPNQLKLNILHQHSSLSDPMGEAFNYALEFKSLDLKAVKKGLRAL